MSNAYLRAFSHLSQNVIFWIGAVCAVLALIGGLLSQNLLLPSWVWLLLTVVIVFGGMVDLQRKLDVAMSPPEPTLTLADFVVYATNNAELVAQGHIDDINGITAIFQDLRQRATLGTVQVWGRDHNSQYNGPDRPYVPIPKEQWRTHAIDTSEFLQDTAGALEHINGDVEYVDLRLNAEQMKLHFKPFKR